MDNAEDHVVLCRKCFKPIDRKSDLVVTFQMFRVLPYHHQCYENMLQTPGAGSMGSRIDGLFGTLGAMTGPVIALFLIARGLPVWLLVIACIPIVYRAIAWFRYEKYLGPS